MIGALELPTVVVQEGGYRTRSLGENALKFFQGLLEGQRPGAIAEKKVSNNHRNKPRKESQ